VVSQVKAFFIIAAFAIIFSACTFHFRPKSTWIFKILADTAGFTSTPFRFKVVFTYLFFLPWAKCISSYFCRTNLALCLSAHLRHFRYIFFSFKQLRPLLEPYISILILSTNFTALICLIKSLKIFNNLSTNVKNSIENRTNFQKFPPQY